MKSLRIENLDDSLILHFGGEFKRINAYTLATTLINVADAAKAANAQLNPCYEIEVVVEALGEGSFKTKIRAIYKSAGNLFSKENAKAVALSVVAAFIYEQALAPDTDVKVTVTSDEVVIEQGDSRIVVPREVHDAMEEVQDNSRFRTSVGEMIEAVEEDEQIDSIAVTQAGEEKEEEEEEPVPIPRSKFAVLINSTRKKDSENEPDEREVTEITEVEILRAILERSNRLWQFSWGGVRISAPVTDSRFFDDFSAHRITIAPGDRLSVRLRIRQKRSETAGVYLNENYEVVDVLKHIPRPAQASLDEGGSDEFEDEAGSV